MFIKSRRDKYVVVYSEHLTIVKMNDLELPSMDEFQKNKLSKRSKYRRIHISIILLPNV